MGRETGAKRLRQWKPNPLKPGFPGLKKTAERDCRLDRETIEAKGNSQKGGKICHSKVCYLFLGLFYLL